MQNNEEVKEKTFEEDRHYRVRVGKEYYIRRRDVEYNDKIISNYFIACSKTINGAKFTFPKKVRFKSDVVLKDNTKILIKDMFEDVMENKKDRANPFWHIFILDFEIVEEPDDMNEAILDYQNNVENIKIDRDREENDFVLF